VDCIWRKRIDDAKPALPHGVRGGEQVVFVFKRSDQNALAHAAFSSPWCSADGRFGKCAAPLISAMAITGAIRQKIRKQLKNKPKLPTKVAISIDVGT
jgi:hypothetical protein